MVFTCSIFSNFEPWNSIFRDSGISDSRTHRGENGDPAAWGLRCVPCSAVCAGHALSNKNTEWHGSMATLLWNSKNVLEWISVCRDFSFLRWNHLENKSKITVIWAKGPKNDLLNAKGHSAKLHREESLQSKMKD